MMTELRVENWSIPAADLGPENPLPAMGPSYDVGLPLAFPGIPGDMARNMALGRLPNYLPYAMQDGYNRARKPRDFKVGVLENDILRAAFLLEMGGRLWSLVHKPSGRELLYMNPVFQPANLAMRNAWFAGGVEWNLGAIAHMALTCSPLFAARVDGPDGTPILRLYEWERIRRVPFQIDVYLPDGSPVLLLQIRIRNPHDHEIPMYWWSNIAVPESDDTRVLVPADSAYRFNSERDQLQVVPVPAHDGLDVTYSTRSDPTVDYFFRLREGVRPWITALDGAGNGLIQFSTPNLRGRKLFIWGQGTGGKNWQAFLSEPGRAYIEIQAGLATTQLEHLPMPARTDWTWLEGYGLLEADPSVVHGSDWGAAQHAVDNALEHLMPSADFRAEYKRGTLWMHKPPAEILHRGSGWGALERLHREYAAEEPFCSAGLVFDDQSLTEAQMPWVELLRSGRFPNFEQDALPKGYVTSSDWRTVLEKSLTDDPESGWMAWMHLGVMRYAAGDIEGARLAWERSSEQAQNPIALRNLAMLEIAEGCLANAADDYVRAHQLMPSLLPLTIETGRTLLTTGQPQRWLDLLTQLPESIQQIGRIRLLQAEAALMLDDLATVQQLFNDQVVVVDLREGERSLSQLWFEYHEKRISREEKIPIDDAVRMRVRRESPVPAFFDFRMSDRDL